MYNLQLVNCIIPVLFSDNCILTVLTCIFFVSTLLLAPLLSSSAPLTRRTTYSSPYVMHVANRTYVFHIPPIVKPPVLIRFFLLLMPMIWIYLMFFYISETTKNIDVYLFLFDDMILITKTKRGRKVSNWCPLTSEQISLVKPLDTFRHWWFVWNSWNTMEHSQPPEIRIFFNNGIKVLIFQWMTTF